jgi:hypothetical protein
VFLAEFQSNLTTTTEDPSQGYLPFPFKLFDVPDLRECPKLIHSFF